MSFPPPVVKNDYKEFLWSHIFHYKPSPFWSIIENQDGYIGLNMGSYLKCFLFAFVLIQRSRLPVTDLVN